MKNKPIRWILIVIIAIIVYRIAYHPIAKEIYLIELKKTSDEAIDCGDVGKKENPTKAIECATKLLKRNKAFYVSFDQRGIDSYISVGLASDGNNEIRRIKYDSNKGGFCLFLCTPSISNTICRNPTIIGNEFGKEEIFWSISLKCQDYS